MTNQNRPIESEGIEEAPNNDVREIMQDYDLDQDTAERVLEIMEDLGVDEDEAIELEEVL